MKVKRISINSNVCHGKPVIKNTRVMVSNILADLAAGRSYDEIIENYPNVTPDDIQAALEFGSQMCQFESVTYEAIVA
jgi:uncharacterized protein (DUF433 family)